MVVIRNTNKEVRKSRHQHTQPTSPPTSSPVKTKTKWRGVPDNRRAQTLCTFQTPLEGSSTGTLWKICILLENPTKLVAWRACVYKWLQVLPENNAAPAVNRRNPLRFRDYFGTDRVLLSGFKSDSFQAKATSTCLLFWQAQTKALSPRLHDKLPLDMTTG